MRPINTIIEFLQQLQEYRPRTNLLNDFIEGKWQACSTEQMMLEIRYAALGLIALGVQRGERIAILAEASSKWTIIDIAIMIAGGISVPIFSNISLDNFQFQIVQTESKRLFFSENIWPRFSIYKGLFKSICCLDTAKMEGISSYGELIAQGKEIDRQKPLLYDMLESRIQPEDLATIVYTSGSVSVPIGAEITQASLVACLQIDVFNFDPAKDPPEERYLNILPLAHIFGRTANLFFLRWGADVYYCHDHKELGNLCKIVKPTILALVPRLLEKIAASIVNKSVKGKGFKKIIGRWALDLAKNPKNNLQKTIMGYLANNLVYKSICKALGGKIRIVISGGAALDPQLCHFFDRIGIPIYEGWGLTEASTVCLNTLRDRKIGSVGKPLDFVEVKASPEEELLIKGAPVMRCYFKNPAMTANAFTPDGWLHTGDKGYIDDEGYVFITGRLKELYKTSTGEFVAPIPIEQALCREKLIDVALVIIEDRPFVTCLLFPDFQVLQQMKIEHHLENSSDSEFLESELIKSLITKHIEKINERLNFAQKVKDFRFITTPLAVETGELTPSMKIRRTIILNKYKKVIDNIYK